MSSAVRQSSAQSYLQQNRIPGLFEELMASLIRDQPSEPLIHLMRTLQRKASERGVAVPVTLRLSPEDGMAATAGPRLPTASAASPAVKSLSATTGAQSAGRSYEKPWLRGSVAVGSDRAGSSMAVKKSTSGGELVAASVDRDSVMFEDSNPLAHGSAQRHRQPSRASIASTGGEAVFLWSSAPGVTGGETSGSGGPPAYATAASVAEAEADILGREFRQARAPSAADANGPEASAVGNSGNKTAARRPTAGSRLAAKEARRKQLEVTLTAAASGKKTSAAESVPGGNEENDDEAMEIEDGVLLLEDSEALAAEGARVSSGRRRRGELREVATTRQRDRLEASAGVASAAGAAAAAEPQVRMTFCGRCFAVINTEDEENGLVAAAAAASGATPLASARGDHHVGSGFGQGGTGRLGGFQHAAATGDEFDELDRVGPHTGRTMTEVTDIESASQVTGPRRPSWTTPAPSGGRSSTTGKSKRAAAPSREEFGGGSTTRSKGLESAASLPSQQQQRQQQRPAASRGWGAAAEAADEFSDSETLTSATGDRHIQQDTRLY